MKKSRVICGVILLICGGTAGAVSLSSNAKSKRIAEILKQRNTGRPLSIYAPERAWLDANGDGMITVQDWLLAKANALFSRKTENVFMSPCSAKQLGRTVFHKDTGILWCAQSGSGIAFIAFGTECRITLESDCSFVNGNSAARYAVYADNELIDTDVLSVPNKEIVIPVLPAGTAIRLIKLSESMNSSLGIAAVHIIAPRKTYRACNGSLFIASPKRAHSIEFIGDSITCGYGVDGVCGKDTFRTKNENAEKAFAILAANALNADYSLVCYSGHGVLSGYTSDGQMNADDLLPKYYGQIGHSVFDLDDSERKIADDSWDFSVQPDLIVINLGTNDASYTGNDIRKQKAFAAEYAAFLKTVRNKNPAAQILCTLGIMGQTLCDAVDEAVRRHSAETGDNRIRVMRFAEQIPDDGFGIDWHPSAITHQKAANALTVYIQEWLGW